MIRFIRLLLVVSATLVERGRAQIPWQSAVASFETTTGPVAAAIDGRLAPDNGWSVLGGNMTEQSAVFIARVPQNATEWQARLVFMDAAPMAYPYCFELAATRDPSPTLESEWTALQPTQAMAICGEDYHNGASFERSVIRLTNTQPLSLVEVRVRSPFPNITAFRINLIPELAVSQASSLTRNPDGACTITEFEMLADPLQATNIANGRPVIASGPVTDGLSALNLTDGMIGTFSRLRPTVAGGRQSHYEIDLGQVWPVHHLWVKGWSLGGAVVELWDSHQGTAAWTGTLPGSSESIRLFRENGEGPSFAGRWLRVGAGAGDGPEQPTLAEVEIYPQLRPFILNWDSDGHPLPLRDAPGGARNLHFEISATAPSPLEAIRVFRFRIPGWRDIWQEVDPRGGIRIPAPPPGIYQIELEAKHSDGVWDASGQPFQFTVLAVWWKSRSFISSLATLVALGGLLIRRQLHIRQLARDLAEARRQGELQSNRLRIARDMHDDIGARLTHIAFLADAAEQAAPAMQGIASEARETVGALDQIVWAVNPRNDTVGGFAEYLSSHAARYLAGTGIRLRENIVISSPDHPLGFETRHSLMMACKESLQNIIKHSGAREARLIVTDANARLTVAFADDGCGLGCQTTDIDRSGLDNMRERLAECSGTCIIESPPEGGVRVTFHLPLETSSKP